MNTTDDRIYVLVYISQLNTWNFIALNNSHYRKSLVLLETWNDRYELCRALYNQQNAIILQNTGNEDLVNKITKGPDLYCVFDKKSEESRAILTVWKSSITDLVQYSVRDNDISQFEHGSFEQLKNNILNLLNINVEQLNENTTTQFLKEFVI